MKLVYPSLIYFIACTIGTSVLAGAIKTSLNIKPDMLRSALQNNKDA